MEDFKNFKKIVIWMMNKNGIATNDILRMSKINLDDYKMIMDEDFEGKRISGQLKASIQEFNKRHYFNYSESLHLDELPDDPDYIPNEENLVQQPMTIDEAYSESEQIPKTEPVEIPEPIPEPEQESEPDKAEVESSAINSLLYNPNRNARRTAERAQEKIFNEALQRLRDVTPDHMTFDIILKHR